MNTTNALTAFTSYANRHNLHYEIADAYGEPGHQDPAEGVILSDWSGVPHNLMAYLDEAGYSMEWLDEWICSDTSPVKCYRTQPGNYSWTPSYFLTEDGEIIGKDEVLTDNGELDTSAYAADEYLEYLKVDRDNVDHYLHFKPHADTFDVDWSAIGFTLQEGEYETGFHVGQNDDPCKIIRELESDIHDGAEVVFQVTGTGQFDVSWKVWVRHADDQKEEITCTQ